MEKAKRKGKLRDIGVSNFNITMLTELIDWAVEPISVVQNWFDPFHSDRAVRKLCAQHNIRYMGYSTLGISSFSRNFFFVKNELHYNYI